DIQLSCNSASDVGSVVVRYAYDEAGNILRVTTADDSGFSQDVRDDVGWSSGQRINTLNQVMRRDVGGDTWAFSYDLNGNMTGKTNGVDTWTYTWNDENRLVRVQGPGGVDVAYVYDFAGRMISRDDGTVTTFTWDGNFMVRENTGMSTTTYCVPEGRLVSFIRDGNRYDVHSDCLQSVRMVTDENGDVVARFEPDAWGGLLESSFDNLPGGMPYTWVGGLGVRFDEASTLYYMRHRWYDPTLQRFISRDPLGTRGGANLYEYADSNPGRFVDPTGQAFTTPLPPIPRPLPPMGPVPAAIGEDLAVATAERLGLRALIAAAAPELAAALVAALAIALAIKIIEELMRGGSGTATAPGGDEGGGKFPYDHKDEGPVRNPTFPPIPPPNDPPAPPRGPGKCHLFIDQVVNLSDGRGICRNSQRMCLFLCEDGSFRLKIQDKNKGCDPFISPMM
ncbi:hypothetical protein JST97_23330, partial [bacterium]|nr:hypothetical protein [bacterium]